MEDGNQQKDLTSLGYLEMEVVWCREMVPRVLKIVSPRLQQKDLTSLLLVSPWIRSILISSPSLWRSLDLREMSKAGDRLLDALTARRFDHLNQINLEFAQDVEDSHFENLRNKGLESLRKLDSLNLNGCQKISDVGIKAISDACPMLTTLSIYWNVRLTDTGMENLVTNCKHITTLNLSGCRNITDKSLQLVADNYPHLQSFNLTRCIKATDVGLKHVLLKCCLLLDLNLYALSSFTDEAFTKMSALSRLSSLDLCGAQNLTDKGLWSIAKCKHLISLNLTWCTGVTDEGVIAIAEGCHSIQFLSLFGNVKVTDRCLAALSERSGATITTLDVNGCTGIKRRSRGDLLLLFPHLTCFKVHS